MFVERRCGGFPASVDRHDVRQETHARLVRLMAPRYGETIGRALSGPDFKQSQEYVLVNRSKWAAAKLLQGHADVNCGNLQDTLVDPAEGPAEANAEKLDMEAALKRLEPSERRIWNLMYGEKLTVREITAEVNMPFQRVGEVRKHIIKTLGDVLRE